MELYKFIFAGTSAVTVLAALLSLVTSALAIRAKVRARYTINRAAASDAELRRVMNKLSEAKSLRPEDWHLAQRLIERHLNDLSERDRAFVEEGLHQPNLAGAKRYTAGMLAG